MKTLCLLLTLFLISCGKPKKDGVYKGDQIHPRTVVTQLPDQQSEKIEVNCYNPTPGGGLNAAYMIKGNFYRGNFFVCDEEFKSCMGRGIFIHYFVGTSSCISKKGFEDQFTLCLEGKDPEERSSNVGPLVRLDLTIDDETDDLWCEKKVLKIMLENS